jgi:hypothetical protein
MEVSHRMKIEICEKCGGGEFIDQSGYRICKYCNTKYLITPEDVARKESNISLNNDIVMLLKKCRDDPANARRYASLVLDMDPGNVEALKILRQR